MTLKEIQDETIRYCMLMETNYTEKIKELNDTIKKKEKKFKLEKSNYTK